MIETIPIENLGFIEGQGADLSIITRSMHVYVIELTRFVANIKPAMAWLLGSLLTIEVLLRIMKDMAAGKNLLWTVFDLIIFIGAIVWFFNDWVKINDSIIMGYLEGGLRVSGVEVKHFMNPSAILTQSVVLAGKVWGLYEHVEITPLGAIKTAFFNYYGWNDTHESFEGGVIQIITVLLILTCGFTLASHVVLAIIEYKFSLLYTMFMVVVGVTTYTKFSLKAAIRYNFATGMRLFVLATMMGVNEKMFFNMIAHPVDGRIMPYDDMMAYGFACLMMALLSWMIPNKISNFIQGGPMLDGVGVLKTAADAASNAAAAVNPKAAAVKVATEAAKVALKAVNPGNSTPGQRDKTGLNTPTKESTIGAIKSGKAPKFKGKAA